ncbi:molybdopterin cofactor-binding domain-containing protein [Micromonospora sp. M12]
MRAPASAPARTPWSPRWTSWPWPSASTRWSYVSATTWLSTPTRDARSPAATWWRACARARSGSAGRPGPVTPVPSRRALADRVGRGRVELPGPARPSSATATARPDGSFLVRINATDIGTGARTAMWQVAADALGVPPERVEIRIGDSALPAAAVAGGSMGTASWSWRSCAPASRCAEKCARACRRTAR